MKYLVAWVSLLWLLSACTLTGSGTNPNKTPKAINTTQESTGSDFAILWERSGGIAGICQQMTIQTDYTYQITDCNNNQLLAEGKLDASYQERVVALLSEYAPLDWQTPQSELGPDAFLDKLKLNGNGTVQADGSSLDQEFAAMVQAILMNQ